MMEGEEGMRNEGEERVEGVGGEGEKEGGKNQKGWM